MRETGWPGLFSVHPLQAAAVLAVGGVALGEGLRPWITSPWVWWGAAGAIAVLGIVRGRGIGPLPVVHPGRPAGWGPGGGWVTAALLAAAVACLAAAHHLAYVGQLRARIPVPPPDDDRPVVLRGWVDGPVEVRDGYVQFPLSAASVRSGPLWGDGNSGRPLPPGTRVIVRVARPRPVAAPSDSGTDDPGGPDSDSDVAFGLESGRWVALRAELRRPEPSRFPGAFSERRYYEAQGVTALGWVPHPRHVRLEDPPAGVLHRPGFPAQWARGLAHRWRDRVESAVRSHTAPEPASLLISMLFGSRDGMDPGVEEAFRRTGLMHLLAVSGLHVGFVGGTIALAAGLLRLPAAGAVAAGGALIALYALAAGGRPPAVRAGVAVFLGLALGAAGRRRDMPTAAALAALALVAHRPPVALDLSFQLSFRAALAIWAAARIVGPWVARGRGRGARLVRGVASGFVFSVAAQLATAPLLAQAFGEVALLGPVANVVAVPLAAVAVPAGLVGGTIADGLGPVGTVLLQGAGFAASALIGWARIVSAIPVDPWQAPPLQPGVAMGWNVALVGLVVMLWPGPERPLLRTVDARLRKAPLLRVIAAALTVSAMVAAEPWRPPVEIYVFDVGQGASALVLAGRRHAVLIDGGRGPSGRPGETDGYGAGRRVVVPALRALGIRRLDAVVATHPHDDHVGGLVEVLAAIPVGELWDGGQEGGGDPSYRRLLELAGEQGISRRSLRAGHVVALAGGARLEVLHPPRVPMEGTGADENNNSLVLRLVYRDSAWLFPGDVEQEGQVHIMASGGAVAAGGMLVPHHGSADAYWRPFWQAVAPQVAVIPVGRNAFGHPSPRVVAALAGMGARVYRTDRHGTVRAWTRGRGWRVRAWAAPCPDTPAAVC